MTKSANPRSAFGGTAEFLVWVLGAVGLSIVARAGAMYRASDPLAFALVALIGAGLVFGTIELVARLRRTSTLAREVEALPGSPTDADVDAASPELRAILRARIAATPVAPSPAPLASYLLGLLVTLGLLGTFLGLFESLRGAREALTASADVAALRAGLAAPVQGLSRAFGTSAAGVSASAMLGLALAIVRRHEARTQSAVAAYAAGPLSSLTVARRTLDALEAIARQGSSLPEASHAIVEAARALSHVSGDIGTGLRTTAAAIRDDLRGVASDVRDELRASGHDTARGLVDAVAPKLEGISAQLSTVASLQGRAHEATIAASNDVASRLEATAQLVAAELRAVARDVRTELRDANDASAERLVHAIAPKLEAVGANVADAVATRLVETERARAEAIAATLGEAVERVVASLDEHRVAWLEGVHQGVERVVASLEAHRAASLAPLNEGVERVVASLETHRASSVERLENALERVVSSLDAHRQSSVEGLNDAIDRVVSSLDAHRQSSVEGLSGAVDRVASSFEAHQAASLERTESVCQRVELLAEELERAANATSTGFVTTAAELASALRAHLETLAATRAELRAEDDAREARMIDATAARLEALSSAVSDALAKSVDEVVASARAAPEAAARIIDEAAKRLVEERARDEKLAALVERLDAMAEAVERQHDLHGERIIAIEERLTAHYERTAELVQRRGEDLGAVAELFAGTVERHREATERWTTGLSAMRAAAERAAQLDAQDLLAAYLEQTHEVFESTMQLQRQLVSELRATRELPSIAPEPSAIGEAEE